MGVTEIRCLSHPQISEYSVDVVPLTKKTMKSRKTNKQTYIHTCTPPTKQPTKKQNNPTRTFYLIYFHSDTAGYPLILTIPGSTYAHRKRSFIIAKGCVTLSKQVHLLIMSLVR